MAFRPDGESIVFVQADGDRFDLIEVDADGQNEVTLAEIGRAFFSYTYPVVPLDDGRVLVNGGNIGEHTVDLWDDGARTVVVAYEEDPDDPPGIPAEPPLVIDATTTAGEFALVAYPTPPDFRGFRTDPNRWSLFSFDGDEFPLAANDGREVVAATLSPDGTHVAYVAIDLPDVDDFEVPPVAELYVATVNAIVAGEPALGSRTFETNAARLADSRSLSLMTWTGDGRVVVAIPDPRETTVVTIDLSPS